MMKYELTSEYTVAFRVKVYRIKALKDFGNVKKGDLGGYVESESNLSQEGNCWIYDNAKIGGNAKVYGNAQVYDNAKVYENAQIYGSASVYGNARVYGNVKMYDNAKVYENAEIYDNAQIFGDAEIFGNVKVYDKALVVDSARVYGNASVSGNAEIRNDAEICNLNDYIVFKNTWSSGRYFTYTKSNKMWSVGCFYGTSDELITKAYKDSKLSGDCYKEYVEFVKKFEMIEK